MSEEKRGRGRPSTKHNGKRVNVYLSAKAHEWLKRRPGGMSEYIDEDARAAIERKAAVDEILSNWDGWVSTSELSREALERGLALAVDRAHFDMGPYRFGPAELHFSEMNYHRRSPSDHVATNRVVTFRDKGVCDEACEAFNRLLENCFGEEPIFGHPWPE